MPLLRSSRVPVAGYTDDMARDVPSLVAYTEPEASVFGNASDEKAKDGNDDLSTSHEKAPYGKDVTREMVLQCVSRAGSKRALNEKVDQYLARLTHVPLENRDIGSNLEVIPQVCPGVRVLYLYDNLITSMSGLCKTRHLTHLHLQNNNISIITGLDTCGTLEKLYLDGNCLRKIDGLGGCVNLKALHASNQKYFEDSSKASNENESKQSQPALSFDVQTVEAIAGSLLHLDISHNVLAETDSVSLLRSLKHLNIKNCGVRSICDLELVLARCGKLRDLHSVGNPFETTEKKTREKIIVLGESLVTLNDKEITTRERVFLKRLERRRGGEERRKKLDSPNSKNQMMDSTLSRTNSHQHHQQHLETIANLGEGTVDHGFDFPGSDKGEKPARLGSPGDLFVPGSPGPLSPGGWRDFPSPVGANSPRNINERVGNPQTKQVVSPHKQLLGTLDGTGTFHDGMESRMNVGSPSLLSPRLTQKALSSTSRGRGGRGRGVASSPRAESKFGSDALDGVGGTAYVPPKRPSVLSVETNAGPDVTSRFEVPDE